MTYLKEHFIMVKYIPLNRVIIHSCAETSVFCPVPGPTASGLYDTGYRSVSCCLFCRNLFCEWSTLWKWLHSASPAGWSCLMTQIVYCVFQEALRNDIPVKTPETARQTCDEWLRRHIRQRCFKKKKKKMEKYWLSSFGVMHFSIFNNAKQINLSTKCKMNEWTVFI